MANLILIAEAAQESSYTHTHLALLLRQGKIKGKKVGGTWTVDLDSLREYESTMKQLGTQKHGPVKKS